VEQSQAALELLDSLLIGDRDDDTLALRASAYKAAGRPERAREELARALAVNPQHPHALVLLAVLELESARVSEGLLAVEAAQQAAPGQYLLWEAQGGLFMHGERWAEAVTAFEHVLAIEPERTSALANMMQALDQLDRDDESKAIFHRLKDRDVTPLIRGVLDTYEAEGW
jgi:tetratricopeptide (TPR) repeat protein